MKGSLKNKKKICIYRKLLKYLLGTKNGLEMTPSHKRPSEEANGYKNIIVLRNERLGKLKIN